MTDLPGEGRNGMTFTGLALALESVAEYTPQGLNHALRIGSIGYVYEPELDRWTHDYRTPEGFFAQHQLTADDIHEIIHAGKYRVTVWEVGS